MNRYQQQLCQNLNVLLTEDYELLNDIICDYVNSLSAKEFDDYERYVNNNLNEIMH